MVDPVRYRRDSRRSRGAGRLVGVLALSSGRRTDSLTAVRKGLHRSRSAQDSGREHDDRGEQREHPADGDPDEPEREQQNPDDRVEDHCQQRERPAQQQEDAPEQEPRSRPVVLEVALYGVELTSDRMLA